MHSLVFSFLKNYGAPNYTDVVYCCILFSFPTYGPNFQIRSLYVTSTLMLKGFLSKNLEQCVFLSKWWVSSLGDIFSGNTPYFHGLLHSSFHSSFPGHMKSTGIQI